MKRVALLVMCSSVLVCGCVSATLTDARLTTLGRTAVPLAGQSLTQQVVEVATCREQIMDSLFYVGAYTLYNPLQFKSREQVLDARAQRLVRCLRERAYDVVEPPRPRSGG